MAPGARARPAEERRQNRRRAGAHYLVGAREQVLERAEVALWPAPRPGALPGLRQRVCGLLDAWGVTLGVGILRAVDTATVTLFTPLADTRAVATVQVGPLILSEEGEELGRVGEIRHGAAPKGA